MWRLSWCVILHGQARDRMDRELSHGWLHGVLDAPTVFLLNPKLVQELELSVWLSGVQF